MGAKNPVMSLTKMGNPIAVIQTGLSAVLISVIP